MERIMLLGSITPQDWGQILLQLGDATLKPENIEWWRNYTNLPQPEAGYQDTDYVAIGRLSYRWHTSAQWFTVHAGCDTIGWGCQGDYAWSSFHSTFEDAVRNGLTKESRRWLGVPLDGEV